MKGSKGEKKMTYGEKLIKGVLELERLKREEKTEEELQAIADSYDWAIDLDAIIKEAMRKVGE